MPRGEDDDVIARYSRGNLLVGLSVLLLFSGLGFWGIVVAPTTRRYIPYFTEAIFLSGAVMFAAMALWTAALIVRVAVHGLAAITVSDGVLQVSVFTTRRFALGDVRQVEIHLSDAPGAYSFPRRLSLHSWTAKPVLMPAIFFRAPINDLRARFESLGIRVVDRRPRDTLESP